MLTPEPAATPSRPPQPLSPPDAQRHALRDLMALATECATTEARLDRELESATHSAAEGFEKTTKTIRFRGETALEQGKQKGVVEIQELTQNHAAALDNLRKSELAARKRADAEMEQAEQLVAKKLQEAAWLADSELEVTLNTLALEEKKLNEEVAANRERLTVQETAAMKQSVTFGYQPSDAELEAARPPETAPEKPAADAPIVEISDKEAKDDPREQFAARNAEVDTAVAHLRGLALPRAFVGITPIAILFFMTVVAGGGAWLATGIETPDFMIVGIAAGAALLVTLLLGVLLRKRARQQVQQAFNETAARLAAARLAAQRQLQLAAQARAAARARAAAKRESEIQRSKEKYNPGVVNARKKYEAMIADISAKVGQARSEAEAAHAAALAETKAHAQRRMLKLQQKLDLENQTAKLHHDRLVSDAKQKYEAERTALANRLSDGLTKIQAPIQAIAKAGSQAPQDWESPAWQTWKPPAFFAAGVRFGQLHVDLMKIARESAGGQANVRLPLPKPFDLPATLAFPNRASTLVQAERDGRAEAIRAVQMIMSRLLVSLPAGRVRFTLIDPVGLGQNFAGFMHLADHDDQLVGGRIWTETDQIDQKLSNLTGHMETVIQKYLRNEFETIDDYNAQAGELAEPYRFLVVSDFPAGFTDDALRRLSSIASSGARCGVYTLIFHDTRLSFPHGVTTLEDLIAHSVTIQLRNADFGLRNETGNGATSANQSAIRNPQSAIVPVWKDPVFEQFPLKLDPPPSEERLTWICDVVGRAAKEAARVEVPFDTIAPPPGKLWSQDSGGDIHVPVGRLGATRLQYMRLGKGVAQHVLIAGKTGSGKSTLLHAMVTNLALWYSPEQVEFYLVDFKKGVEFKTYATHNLPHARAIAVESDREFGISVLQRLDAELTRRGELFRAAGVQDLASYRKTPNPQVIPRTLLIIDEFQEFFSEDDKIAQEAAVLLDRLVRQGRAFGIHCLLGSQTIAGSSGLPRATIGQMAVRVALQTSEADSQLILGDNNSAARLLSRPGEAIYNDQGGLVEGNSPFQVAWLPDERKDQYLDQVRSRADQLGIKTSPAIVFEGNAPADLSKNGKLSALLSGRETVAAGAPPRAWVGEPVAIKEPTAIAMRRQSGANVLVIGQAEDAAMATMAAMMLSLAAQVRDGKFYILDATPADSPLAGTFAKLKEVLPQDVQLVEWRATGEAVNEIATEMGRRRDGQDLGASPIFLFVIGLQRYRILRKAEDEFGSFSMGGGDEPKPADPGKQFAEILKDGPAHGIHVLTWADTATAVDRTLDRGTLREFDNRVLFQMSANDSSNLIDSPAANKLGFHRALAYSEEQGVMEKFRPYALPTAEFLASVKAYFAAPR
jgi:hypothetical protein